MNQANAVVSPGAAMNSPGSGAAGTSQEACSGGMDAVVLRSTNLTIFSVVIKEIL